MICGTLTSAKVDKGLVLELLNKMNIYEDFAELKKTSLKRRPNNFTEIAERNNSHLVSKGCC